MEEWRWVPGFEGKYQVSDSARVRSFAAIGRPGSRPPTEPRELTPVLQRHGYFKVFLGRGHSEYLHRLVALAFVSNPAKQSHVNHINGVKTDCTSQNLEWVSQKENNQHARESGLHMGVDYYVRAHRARAKIPMDATIGGSFEDQRFIRRGHGEHCP